MSLFLGFIHHLMYDKILFLENIIKDLENLSKIDISKEVDEVGIIPIGKLEDIIDQNNIHGYLENLVNIVEHRFSKVVSILLKDNISYESIKKVLYENGYSLEAANNPREAFLTISNKFLDGMPCDHAILPIEIRDDYVKYKVQEDMHKDFWEDKNIYWQLREEFIRGFLDKSNMNFNFFDDKWEIY